MTDRSPLAGKILSYFNGGGYSAPSLSELAHDLLAQQQQSWPQLIDGYAALKDVQHRTMECEGFSVSLQYNPKRIVSSGAKVDADSIRGRKCFLSIENLPQEQKAILYRDTFLFLCNPAPIFDRHFTISYIDHIPQEISPFVETMLMLAYDLAPDFIVFYNGPRCGASAPDHMHFQACPSGTIPVDTIRAGNKARRHRNFLHGVQILTLENFGRSVLVLEGTEQDNVKVVFDHVYRTLKETVKSEEEPMLNVISSYSEERGWRMTIFPRAKHRPDVYFLEGDKQILISPAAVDIGGLVITPVEKDFLGVEADMIEKIFHEVTLPSEKFEAVIARL